MKRPGKDKPIRCLLDVRKIPLEFFKHSRDGRKWRQPARNRYNLLLMLASYANPDGNLGPYSPSVTTLTKHYAERTLYSHLDDLRDLGFLTWVRNQHYYRREYQISLPDSVKHLQDSPPKQVQDSDETPARLETTPATVAKTPATATQHIRLYPSKEPSKEPAGANAPDPSISAPSNKPTGREEIARQYFVWLLANYDGLSFTGKNKATIYALIAGSSYSLTELQAGTARILDPLDIKDPFVHADNRLAESLPASCGAGILEGEGAKREAARRAVMAKQAELAQERLRQQADAELAEIRRKKAEDKLAHEVLMAELGDCPQDGPSV